ncbi:biogenesis of lysosome-related organelles complex 1 subunit 5 [Agrilus planipennis]|uniref:Biogenesis of lysosome-related organelles complex 1 subunit 5 n=1 Tax=Agrilus planipennis TaxID=224129 RepID=A0A1W4XFD5_AGRPL|nr:biogenesis of lysosome-related organelles complex 1 subunit 5 [Agrilus planipennis]
MLTDVNDMTDICKDANSIWSRLFDHKAFLNGEVQFFIREFERKRNDWEVEQLFTVLEKVTDIKVTQIDRFKQSVNLSFPQINIGLSKVSNLSDNIILAEEKYKTDTTLEQAREQRKLEWQQFVDNMSHACNNIDTTFEQKEKELEEFYTDLEEKLQVGSAVP